MRSNKSIKSKKIAENETTKIVPATQNLKSKLILPISILSASIILGGFLYASQVNKQRSIERQQRIKLVAEKQEAEIKAEQENKEVETKAEQENKEYIAKRKGECYKLYEKESEKWNNEDSYSYNEIKDVCTITYKNKDWKEGEDLFASWVDKDGDGVKETYKEGKYFTKDY